MFSIYDYKILKMNNRLAFPVGQRVMTLLCGKDDKPGTVTQLWMNSPEARTTGYYHLDKFKVKLDNGGTMWLYGCDLRKL